MGHSWIAFGDGTVDFVRRHPFKRAPLDGKYPHLRATPRNKGQKLGKLTSRRAELTITLDNDNAGHCSVFLLCAEHSADIFFQNCGQK